MNLNVREVQGSKGHSMQCCKFQHMTKSAEYPARIEFIVGLEVSQNVELYIGRGNISIKVEEHWPEGTLLYDQNQTIYVHVSLAILWFK
jgi:hypothetical protein